MNQTQVSKNYIAEFCQLIEQGKQCWIEAGKKLAEAAEKIPNFINLMLEACPHFTERFLRKMIDLGHGALHPDLLIGESTGERRLARLPYSWQEKHAMKPVELLVKRDKEWDTLLVPVRDLTPEQCNQVFDDSAVRTTAQQRSYLESVWAKRVVPPKQTNSPYRIIGGQLVVMSPAKFSRKELAKILAEMS